MPEITKNEDVSQVRLPTFIWIALAALAVFVYFFGLYIPFVGPDEARFAQVAREMLERNDWITPTLGDSEWFEKPALLYWLEIASYRVFGVSEFAARFGPAVFGLGTVASLWILGHRLSTDRNSKIKDQRSSSDFANWLALIAASTLGLLVFARGASFDIVVTFPITAALVSFFVWHARTEADPDTTVPRRPSDAAPLVLFYVFSGIALLAKGLIGILFPFAIVGVFYAFSRWRPSGTFLISLIWGTLLATVIASSWYAPMYQRYGYRFIDEFFIQHHFQRFTSNKYQHPQPFYFFLWVLPLMTLPWLPLFLAGIWSFIRDLFQRRNVRPGDRDRTLPHSRSPHLPTSPSPLLLFSLAWLIVPLCFFSLSGSKLPGYVLPALPGAIILTAIFVFGLVEKSSKWRNIVLTLAAATFVGTILLVVLALPRFADTDSVRSLIGAATERGYTTNRVLTLHTISYNAEFYAAGRLLRDQNGKQRRLSTISEVLAEAGAENGRPVLVLVPVEYVSQLQREPKLTTQVLKDNGELSIAVVSLK